MSDRSYIVNGVTLVKVKGSGPLAPLSELGLATDQIKIYPRWQHKDLNVDDFGPNIPPEVIWLLADCQITMNLIHADPTIIQACIDESMGGSSDGTLAPAGRPMGGGVEIFKNGNHYISLNLLSPTLKKPWRFRATYLAERPVEYPLGTDKSVVALVWRAIPYAYPSVAGGTPGEGKTVIMNKYPLWDRSLDTPPVQL